MIPAQACGAWRDIETRLRPYVSRRVPSSELDDVLQEIFIRMHRGLSGLRDGERFGAWAYRIAERVISDARRKRSPPAQAQDEEREIQAVDEDHDADLELGLDECVALFVARLPSPYREAITLTDLQGLTQKEAAEMAGVSLSGMKSRVQRGRNAVREMFEQCCEISLDGRGRVMGCEPRSPAAIPPDCREAATRGTAQPGEKGGRA